MLGPRRLCHIWIGHRFARSKRQVIVAHSPAILTARQTRLALAQFFGEGVEQEHHAIRHAAFSVDTMEVNFHGTNLQPKLLGDNFIVEPAQHELRYFQFAWG